MRRLNRTFARVAITNRGKWSQGQRGGALLWAIGALLILGVFAASVAHLSTSAQMTQVEGVKRYKAALNADSGHRMLVGEYNKAMGVNRNVVAANDILRNTNGKSFELPDNQGGFELQLAPTWMIATQAYAKNALQLVLEFPGKIPRDATNPSLPMQIEATGKIRVNKALTRMGRYTSRTIDDAANRVTFNFAATDPFPYALAAGDELFLVFNSDEAAVVDKTVNLGGSLTGLPMSFRNFPEKNGTFLANRHYYTYEQRVIGVGSVSLLNVRPYDPTDTSAFPLKVKYDQTANATGQTDPTYFTAVTDIALGKNLQVNSVGTYGAGGAKSESKQSLNEIVTGRGNIYANRTLKQADIIGMGDFQTPENKTAAVDVDLINKLIYLGGNIKDGHGAFWYAGDTELGYCLDGKCIFAGGINAFYKFTFINSTVGTTPHPDTTSDSTDSADGYVFAMVNGKYNDKNSYGGAPVGKSIGEMVGYAGPGQVPNGSGGYNNGKGLLPPKIGVEVDTYPNTGAPSPATSPYNWTYNTRKDNSPFKNHIALLYWGEGRTVVDGNGNASSDSYDNLFDDNIHGYGGTNATTPVTPRNSTDFVTFASDLPGHGYWPIPKNGSNNGLEDAVEHNMRVEVRREVEDPDSDGFYVYEVKVWVDCNADVCADVTTPFTGSTPQVMHVKTKNSEAKLHSTYHNEFTTFLFGFSEATGGKAQVVMLKDSEFYFRP